MTRRRGVVAGAGGVVDATVVGGDVAESIDRRQGGHEEARGGAEDVDDARAHGRMQRRLAAHLGQEAAAVDHVLARVDTMLENAVACAAEL